MLKQIVSELQRQAALNITMKLKHNSLFLGGGGGRKTLKHIVLQHCYNNIVCKGKGHQQARKVDRLKAIAENCRKFWCLLVLEVLVPLDCITRQQLELVEETRPKVRELQPA